MGGTGWKPGELWQRAPVSPGSRLTHYAAAGAGATHGTFHSVRWRRSAPDPVGRCRFQKTRVSASVADTHTSLAMGVVRGAPEVLSKIEFGRMPVTLVIAVEPERGQIL
jgi:hypothetical protein